MLNYSVAMTIILFNLRATMQSSIRDAHADVSVSGESNCEFSASARLSFTQFLRKDNHNRSSSEEQNANGPQVKVSALMPAAPFLALNSGKSSPIAFVSSESKISNQV